MKEQILMDFQKQLVKYYPNAALRYDRKDSPYLNVGNVRNRSERAQIWYENGKIRMWVGVHMGSLYSFSSNSVFRKH